MSYDGDNFGSVVGGRTCDAVEIETVTLVTTTALLALIVTQKSTRVL